MKPYQFSRPLGRAGGKRDEKCFQKTILFKVTYAKNFFQIRLTAQF